MKKGTVRLNLVLHVTQVTHDLLSVLSLCDANHAIFLMKDKFVVQKGNEIVCHGKRDEGMYSIELEIVDDPALTVTNKNCRLLEVWHRRLAHAGRRVIEWMEQKSVVKDLNMSKLPTLTNFSACIKGTTANTTMQSCRHVEMRPSLMVHTDVAEMNERSTGGKK